MRNVAILRIYIKAGNYIVLSSFCSLLSCSVVLEMIRLNPVGTRASDRNLGFESCDILEHSICWRGFKGTGKEKSFGVEWKCAQVWIKAGHMKSFSLWEAGQTQWRRGLLCFVKEVMNCHLQDELPGPPATAECPPWLAGSKCDPALLPGQCSSQILCQERELGLHFSLGMVAETTSAVCFLLPSHLGAVYYWRILWGCASKSMSGKSKKLKHFCKHIKLKKAGFLIKKIPSKDLQGVQWKEIIWLAKETDVK